MSTAVSEHELVADPARQECSREELLRERDQLRAERDALLRSQRLRDETIALVVHDMKNPLAGVLSNAEYLVTSKGMTTDQSDCASDILGAARRLHRQIMCLIDVNLREHGVLDPVLSSFDFAELLEQARANAAQAIRDKSLRCLVSVEVSPLLIRADRDMLARLLANLFDNAIRSAPPGSELEIDLARRGDALELRFTDHGPRFSGEYRAQIFDTYVRSDESIRRARKARGLGLASCRAVVEAHGGTIALEDAQPEGSTFRVMLPLRAAGRGGS